MATTSTDTPQRIDNTSKKVLIIASYFVDQHANRQRTADSLGCSYEYVRKVVRDLQADEREMVSDYELEAARDELLQAEVAQRMREYNAISEDTPTTIKVSSATLQREIARLNTLEESASRGDDERAWVAGSARDFLEGLIKNAN